MESGVPSSPGLSDTGVLSELGINEVPSATPTESKSLTLSELIGCAISPTDDRVISAEHETNEAVAIPDVTVTSPVSSIDAAPSPTTESLPDEEPVDEATTVPDVTVTSSGSGADAALSQTSEKSPGEEPVGSDVSNAPLPHEPPLLDGTEFETRSDLPLSLPGVEPRFSVASNARTASISSALSGISCASDTTWSDPEDDRRASIPDLSPIGELDALAARLEDEINSPTKRSYSASLSPDPRSGADRPRSNSAPETQSRVKFTLSPIADESLSPSTDNKVFALSPISDREESPIAESSPINESKPLSPIPDASPPAADSPGKDSKAFGLSPILDESPAPDTPPGPEAPQKEDDGSSDSK